MFLANIKPLSKIYAVFSIAEPKKNKNDQVMGNSQLKSFQGIYQAFVKNIFGIFYYRTGKKKNGQVMGNSELTLKIHFKLFSNHNMLEVELFQQMIYRIFCKSIIAMGSYTNWVKYS